MSATGRGALVLLLLAVLGQAGAAQSEKRVHVRGYVVEVVSPVLLTIDDYRVTEDRTYRIRLDAPVESIHIGTDVEVDATVDAATGEFRAASVKPRVEPLETIKLPTILSKPPHDGVFRADGRFVRVEPATRVIFTKTREPLTSLDQVGADTLMSYVASRREPDGTIVAEKVEVRRNETEAGERDLSKRLEMSLKEPDFERHRAGSLRIYRSQYYELVADADVQQYVTELGWRLVPQYQRDMPDGDPTKIAFKFYVAKRDEASAVALQNGVVIVYSRLFDTVENEAQLAAAIGHEIAHVTQEHRWQLARKVDWALGGVYSRAYENQADRLGLEYMVDAGYDPREAPRVWKVLSRKFGFTPTNGFGSSHDNHSLRRAYLMGELENDYRDLDYTLLKTEEERFKRMAGLVKGAVDPGWKARNPQ